MNVRLGDIRLGEECIEAVNVLLRAGQLTEGAWVKLVEELWASYLGVKHAVAVSSGTTGLMTALMATSPDPEIPVTVPALTFAATWNAALALGHPLSFTECDGLLMRLPTVEPSVLIPVHLMGVPHFALKEYREQHPDNIVIEDCCEAPGAEIAGRKVGTFGDCGVFSFYGSHPCPAGEFGFVVTGNDALAQRLRMIKNHGRPLAFKPGYFIHDCLGLNFKVPEISACIAWHQLRDIDDRIARRLANTRRYSEVKSSRIGVFEFPAGASPHGQVISVLGGWNERDALISYLFQNGVECRAMFPIPEGNTPIALTWSQHTLYVPVHEYLTDEQLTHVVGLLNRWRWP